jgi:WD40 repeat protein
MYPNKCVLYKIKMPNEINSKWEFNEVARYEDDEYCSNLWLLQLSSNGKYVACPSTEGHIFIWNLKTKKLETITKDHIAEPRQSLFHPSKKLFLSCGDDSKVNIYIQSEYKNNQNIKPMDI